MDTKVGCSISNVFESQKLIAHDMFIRHLSCNGDSRPLMLICETINSCNNDCIICAHSRMTRKKTIMPMNTFEKVVNSYSAMGGGYLSLTPVVGDIFMDKYLPERIKVIKRYKNISSLSVTTNAVMAGRFSDTDLAFIIKGFNKIFISIYGLDREEYLLMTKRDSYFPMIESVRRMLKIIGDEKKISFGFRALKAHTEDQLRKWIFENFSTNIEFHHMNVYSNWGVLDTTEKLPFAAKWKESVENTSQCLIPLLAMQVFSDGRVSFCACDDFDAVYELSLGNINDNVSLLEMYNSEKARELWHFEKKMPLFCKKCSFHIPLSSLPELAYVLEDPLNFIGG